MACSLVLLLFSGDFISPGTRLSQLPMTAALIGVVGVSRAPAGEPFGRGRRNAALRLWGALWSGAHRNAAH